MKSQIYYNNPNFSIVLPGPCQAHCDFCFWTKKKTADNYLDRLKYVLDNLPACFTQVSLTGGEPTLSPYFKQVCDILSDHREKIKKVVLSTNGAKLFKYIGLINWEVDFVNISRHHWNQKENEKIFGTKNIPTSEHLKKSIDLLKDVTINCVIKDMNPKEMITFLKYVYRELGTNKVAFRQEHGTLEPVAIEKYLLKNHKKIGEGSCPVCRSVFFDVELDYVPQIMSVAVKYSVMEPSSVIDGIYELILHPDGKLTADWDAKIEVDLLSE